jgi:hypothetical protein
VVDIGYRFYRDDWGIRAHTLDLRYRWELGSGTYINSIRPELCAESLRGVVL